MQIQGFLRNPLAAWILSALAFWAILTLLDRSQDLEPQRSPAGRPGAHKAHRCGSESHASDHPDLPIIFARQIGSQSLKLTFSVREIQDFTSDRKKLTKAVDRTHHNVLNGRI